MGRFNSIEGIAQDIVNHVNESTAELVKRVEKTAKKKGDKVTAYRREASRMAALANKRLARLENNNLLDSPAYRGFLESGGAKFSVRGKTHNELQKEVARLNAFINAKTSTIRGATSYIKEIAANTGIKYKSMTELRKKAPKFFELANKVEEYLRTVDDMASAIGYQKIWEAVNTYTDTQRIDLSSSERDVDDMIKDITDAIREYEKPEYINLDDLVGFSGGTWFELPKE